MKVIETHFVLEVTKAMGETYTDIRKVYKIDRLADTYLMESTSGRGAVIYKHLTDEEFKEMSNALALKLYKEENPDG